MEWKWIDKDRVDIEPKPTFYNGVEYASALESKYAMAFDKLGIKFTHETNWFRGDGLKYNPDFKLIDQGVFFEVKGFKYEAVEQKKFRMVAENNQVLFIGDNNGFLYRASKKGLSKAKLVRCLSCLEWYIDTGNTDFVNSECPRGCKRAKYDMWDNLFDAVGEHVYERKRRWPLGDYPDLPCRVKGREPYVVESWD